MEMEMENEEKAFGKEEPSKKKPKIDEDEDEDEFQYEYPELLKACGKASYKRVMEKTLRITQNEEEFMRQIEEEFMRQNKKEFKRTFLEDDDARLTVFSPRFAYTPPLRSQVDEQKLMCIHHRAMRSHEAFARLTRDYKFVKGIKCCISSTFQSVTSTGEYCFDSSWAAVHGFDTICMVTCRKSLDMTRLGSYYRACHNENQALLNFSEAVISEVECIPYDGSMYKHEDLRRCCSGKVMKPFGVVSLVQTTEKSEEKAIDPVIKFLEQKMKDKCSAFNDYKTLETAIGAYKCMCPGQELKAEDILVAIMDVSGGVTSGAFSHLDIDIIREELEIVNGGCSRTNSRRLMHRNTLRDSANAPSLDDILMSLRSKAK